jgi:hypothetical protein
LCLALYHGGVAIVNRKKISLFRMVTTCFFACGNKVAAIICVCGFPRIV